MDDLITETEGCPQMAANQQAPQNGGNAPPSKGCTEEELRAAEKRGWRMAFEDIIEYARKNGVKDKDMAGVIFMLNTLRDMNEDGLDCLDAVKKMKVVKDEVSDAIEQSNARVINNYYMQPGSQLNTASGNNQFNDESSGCRTDTLYIGGGGNS